MHGRWQCVPQSGTRNSETSLPRRSAAMYCQVAMSNYCFWIDPFPVTMCS